MEPRGGTPHPSVPVFGSQKIFPLSPETEGKKGDSLSTERRGLPLATATAAITLAASLYSRKKKHPEQTINYNRRYIY